MATAILNLGKTHKIRRARNTKKPKAAQYVARESKKKQILRAAKKYLFNAVIFLIITSIAGAVAFFYFYDHYLAMVDRRVKSGFWHSRAGVYSAPFVLRKDQKATLETVIDHLRRSGYVEGGSAEEIWNGNFLIKGETIEINSRNFTTGEIETAAVRLKNNRIAEISNGEERLDEFEIEPELLTNRTETKRGKNHVLKYEDIPENLKNAILTAEDRRFFEHHGVDPQGIVRAMIENFKEGSIRQGGSTITQQLVKNTFLSPERSLSRKFAEAFLALALEKRMSKEEIFTLYCNEIYLGQYGLTGIHGVEQAARAYFDKDLQDLSLQESAAIAAMIKNPTRYAPHKNADEAKERRKRIIAQMEEQNLVSLEEAETAQNAELQLAKPKANNQAVAPYFVDSATKEINRKFSTDYLNSNFNTRIYTTIDTQLQSLAEAAVAEHLASLDKIYAKKGYKLQASLVSIDPQTGHILAMVGGRDYKESQFNRATDAYRQPGSTFKPFVYAAAFERGMTPATVYSDSPTEFRFYNYKDYKPANYGDSYAMKNITLKSALVKSSNVVAVKTSIDAGLGTVGRKAREFGFEIEQAYPSTALGTIEVTPLQLAAAYATFANGGRRIEPTFIDKIISVEDEILYQSSQENEQIVSPRTAYMITDMLRAVVERGTARRAAGALGKEVVFAGKTGSSKDGWFVGYTPNLVTVAWIGVDDNEDIHATGGEIALPLWVDYMKSVVGARPEFGGGYFPMPRGLSEVTVDPETGMLAGVYCPQREKVVVPYGAVSGINCYKHQPLPEPFTASIEEPEISPTPNESEIEAIIIENEKFDSEPEKIKSAPPEKVEKSNREPKRPELKKTYLEDFERERSKSGTDN